MAECELLHRELSDLRDAITALERAVTRLETIIQSNGLSARVGGLEKCVTGGGGVLERLAVIEHRIGRLDKLVWLVVSLIAALIIQRMAELLLMKP